LSPRPRRGDTYRQLADLRDRTRHHDARRYGPGAEVDVGIASAFATRIWHNWLTGAPNKRSLIAYDHSDSLI
jgi:hypothetical protein